LEQQESIDWWVLGWVCLIDMACFEPFFNLTLKKSRISGNLGPAFLYNHKRLKMGRSIFPFR
jgi:hypothetical protein